MQRLTLNGKIMAGHGLFYDANNTVTLTQLSQQLNSDCTSAFELWDILDLLCSPLLKPFLRREHNNTAVYQSLIENRYISFPKVESRGGGFWIWNLDKLQYSDGLRFPTHSWPNLGLKWSICSKSRVASSCLPGMMNIHSSIRKYVEKFTSQPRPGSSSSPQGWVQW